jgi:hypothetical protein
LAKARRQHERGVQRQIVNDFSNHSADRWQLCSTSNEQQRAVDNGGIPKRARRRARHECLGRNNSRIELNEIAGSRIGT